MTEPAPYVLGPNEGEPRWGFGGSLTTVKATGEQTGGLFAIIEDLAPKGEGTPRHVHRDDDETFYVLEGELSFYLEGEEPFHAAAGAFVHIPKGVVHAFKIGSDTARYLIITTPKHGLFYDAISVPARSRSMPEEDPLDMAAIEAACQQFDVEILGPPPGAEA